MYGFSLIHGIVSASISKDEGVRINVASSIAATGKSGKRGTVSISVASLVQVVRGSSVNIACTVTPSVSGKGGRKSVVSCTVASSVSVSGSSGSGNYILLETGNKLLLATGDRVLRE